MKLLVIKLMLLVALGNPEVLNATKNHSATTGKLNLEELKQIESLVRKKAGAELEKSHENSFVLNGHNVYTEVISRRYGPTVFEESFYDINDPENEFRMRLVKNINGDQELAVLIRKNGKVLNYHACFDSNGNMLDYDPWGREDGYSIKIFELYKEYRKIYAQRVDALK